VSSFESFAIFFTGTESEETHFRYHLTVIHGKSEYSYHGPVISLTKSANDVRHGKIYSPTQISLFIEEMPEISWKKLFDVDIWGYKCMSIEMRADVWSSERRSGTTWATSWRLQSTEAQMNAATEYYTFRNVDCPLFFIAIILYFSMLVRLFLYISLICPYVRIKSSLWAPKHNALRNVSF
jgi:hypothetical protein